MDLSRFEAVLLYRRGQSQRTGTLRACHFLLTAPQPLSPKALDEQIEQWFFRRWQYRLERALATLST